LAAKTVAAMTLPATFHEVEIAQVRQLADQLVEQLLTEDLLGMGIPMLHPNAGQVSACRMYKSAFVENIFSRQTILQAALNGFAPARTALGELVVEIRKEDWPRELETFAVACANPYFDSSARPGARKLSHALSDIAFVSVVSMLWKRFPNVPPTSQSGRRVCHCDIAADAFTKRKDRIGRGKMSRTQGMKIWQRAKKRKIHGINETNIVSIFSGLS
jgi:hypothetical protein